MIRTKNRYYSWRHIRMINPLSTKRAMKGTVYDFSSEYSFKERHFRVTKIPFNPWSQPKKKMIKLSLYFRLKFNIKLSLYFRLKIDIKLSLYFRLKINIKLSLYFRLKININYPCISVWKLILNYDFSETVTFRFLGPPWKLIINVSN